MRHDPSYKQLEVDTNRTPFLCANLRTSQHGTQNVKTHNRTAQKTKKMGNTCTDPTKKSVSDFIVLNATFNNISAISWRPVLVVEEAGVPGENHRPWASNW